ncbi:MAG: TolB family protein [Vicinamibacterales bacterium]
MRTLLAVGLSLALAASAAAQNSLVSLPEGHEFTNPERGPFSLSPDGTSLVYLARATVFVRAIGGGASTLIPGPLQGRGKSNPVFSPDGRQILYWAQDDSVLQRVAVSGGTPVTIARVGNPLGLSWGEDGQILVGAGPDGVQRVQASGGVVETIIRLAPGESARQPQMLPGGDLVLFTLAVGTPTNWEQARVVVQSLRSGNRTVVTSGRDARFVPSGHLVYVAGTTLVASAFDARTLVAGPPTTLAPSIASNAGTGGALLSVAANGALAYVSNNVAPIQLERVGLDGTRRKLGAVPAGTTAPRVSHDGTTVTFAAAGDIYVADLENVAGAKKVIANGTFPLFSPDGQWLAFGSLGTTRNNGEERLFMQRADGSGEAELIVKPGRAPEHWREGDQGFTFITHRGGANNYDLWVYAPDKKEVEPLVVVNESAQLSSALSPDRKWFAYMSSESGDWQIYVQPYPATGAKYQATTTGGRSPMWTADGRLVYDNDGKLFAIATTLGAQPRFGSPVELPVGGHIQPLLRRNWDMMPNGMEMLMLFRPGPAIQVVRDWTGTVPAR